MDNIAVLPSAQREAGLRDLGPTEFDERSTIGELTFAVMREQVGRYLEVEAGVRTGDDIEAVHDMRVASRRLRAAIGLFRTVLPASAVRLRAELRWIARALGEVRDLDVQRQQLAAWIEESEEAERGPLERLDSFLADRRAAAQARVVRALDSPRHARLCGALLRLVRRGPSRRVPGARLPATLVAPEIVADRYRAVRKAGRRLDSSAPDEDLHRLRIRCKRLRYTLEFAAPLYPDRSEQMIRRLVRLQDVLGEIHDSEIAVSSLHTLRERSGRRIPADALFAMGRVAERHGRRADELRALVPDAVDGVRGKRWKRLKREMERARSAGTLAPLTSKPPTRDAEPPAPTQTVPTRAEPTSALTGA